MHHAAFGPDTTHEAVGKLAAHRTQFFRRVAVARAFFPRLLAREGRRSLRFAGFILRQSDMSRSQHGTNLANASVQGKFTQKQRNEILAEGSSPANALSGVDGNVAAAQDFGDFVVRQGAEPLDLLRHPIVGQSDLALAAPPPPCAGPWNRLDLRRSTG
jgi:hypothetical protein